ncbi:JAB domain-containing protein [Aliivibrio fischeri]|uniref:JAB domain-containing protein n=1 Tax=Aliivibrio fischeri TaxID=668 RepID=UPI0012D8F84F|nr:JAB domain-containing protein [Aliivibrio fischeri]MUJ20329.1 hypothetical protein [Aliivibrio fischeri]
MNFYTRKNINDDNLPKGMWVYSEMSDLEAVKLIPKNLIMEAAAQYLLDDILASETIFVNKPDAVVKYLRTSLKHKKNESFGMVLLSTSNKILGIEYLCSGTIDSAAVYPRNVVEAIISNELPVNAVVFFHNHPSGQSTPSQADKNITKRLVAALGLIDVRVLDHIIIGDDTYVFSEHGLI